MLEEVLKYFTIVTGFYMAWNIGANDVANAVSTSVGSKAVTLKKAVILAAILEFLGAYFLGGKVTDTIQSKIVLPAIFSHTPMIYIIGMLSALLATGLWLNVASYFRMPISTTHAIVGAVFGFGLVVGGLTSINWVYVCLIAGSWVITPFISGAVAFFIFKAIQHNILYALNPLLEAKKIVPLLIFCLVGFFCITMLFGNLENSSFNISFLPAFFISILIALIPAIIAILYLKKYKITSCPIHNYHPQHLISLEKAAKHLTRLKYSSCGDMEKKATNMLNDINIFLNEVKQKVNYPQNTSEYAQVEKIFGLIQIMSLCLIAFAHGSNDVANAIGPVAAVLTTLKEKAIMSQTLISKSLLLLGAFGIVFGLSTWGWRVIETIAHKITALTPTRGFSAEFAAALTILIASKFGLPISTTHALIGAILGVGFARGLSALNLKTIKDVVSSWIVTIPICMILSIIFYYILKSLLL